MGPLSGVRVVELAGIGPVPFCAMLLGDLGADVIRVDRVSGGPGALPGPLASMTGRSRRSVAVDLKQPDGVDVVLDLIAGADVLLEGFRPGVAERLGIGPEVCLERQPRLVYGRMTGWGREGALAATAGHDITYIALTGVLDAIGPVDGAPVPPLNLVGDYGGGALYLALGVLAALHARESTGRGDIVDAAIIDGSASLMTAFYELAAEGFWNPKRGSNLLDGGAPFYATYRTADDGYIAVGALEPQFYAALLAGLGIDPEGLPAQYDVEGWPEIRERFTQVFATRGRDEWEAQFSNTDACVAPVLTLFEAARHPHHAGRDTFVEIAGAVQPAPAPRFASSPNPVPEPAPRPGAHTAEVLAEMGYPDERVADLVDGGIVAGP